jgi:hypothetical protein
MALGHYSFYILGLIWGLFLKRFWFPLAAVGLVFHEIFYKLVFGRGSVSETEYVLWLPVSFAFGLCIGYFLSAWINLRRLLFLRADVRHGWWLFVALVEFTVLHAVLVFWEITSVFPRPWNVISTFLIYLVFIPLSWIFTCRARVWEYRGRDGGFHRDDNAAGIFHALWGLFHLTATFVFGLLQWTTPSFWQFWVSLIVFGAQLLLLLLLRYLAHTYDWKSLHLVRSSCDGVYEVVGAVCGHEAEELIASEVLVPKKTSSTRSSQQQASSSSSQPKKKNTGSSSGVPTLLTAASVYTGK